MDHLVKDGILTQEQRDKTWEFIVSHQSEEAEKLSKKREQCEVAQSEELSIPKRVVATEKDVDFFNLHVMSRLLQIRFKNICQDSSIHSVAIGCRSSSSSGKRD